MPIQEQEQEQVTILRIKRKRTEEPLEALVVQQDNDRKPFSKRFRNENTQQETDTSPPPTPRSVPTLFRLAETVEEHHFNDLTEAKKLKERIARHLQPRSRPQTPDPDAQRGQRIRQQMEVSRRARYRLINRERSLDTKDQPPAVHSASAKAASELFQMYEAVKDDNEPKKDTNTIFDEDIEEDDVMCNFIPMVKEYLTLNEQHKSEAENDFVYDVYYCDNTQSKSGINLANVGSLVWFENESVYMNDDNDSEPADEEDEDSNAEDYYKNDYPDEESGGEFEDQNVYNLSSEDEEYY